MPLVLHVARKLPSKAIHHLQLAKVITAAWQEPAL
nr:MAG TPA: hypothetical protein [Caudoviricetes sp.]